MHSTRGIESHGLTLVVRAWLPVVLYVALIFTLSSIPALGPPLKAQNIDKVAHFFEYGLLGILLARGLRRTLPGRPGWHILILVAMIGLGVAALDEVYQGTRGREQSLGDWAADGVGLTALSTAFLWMAGSRQTRPDRDDSRQRSVNS